MVFGFIGRKLIEKNVAHAQRVIDDCDAMRRAAGLALYFDPEFEAIIRRAPLTSAEEVILASNKFSSMYNKSKGMVEEDARTVLELVAQYLYLVGTEMMMPQTGGTKDILLSARVRKVIIQYENAFSFIRRARDGVQTDTPSGPHE